MPAEWKTFSSADFGYSFTYPATWFDLGNFGVEGEHYFSTNKDAGAPSLMSASDIFIGVDANCQYILGASPKLISKAPISVGGIVGERYVETASSVGGNLASAMVTIETGPYCYRVSMLAFTVPVIERHLADFDQMLRSVRFSARIAPPLGPKPTAVPT